jgi:hypothetical protein
VALAQAARQIAHALQLAGRRTVAALEATWLVHVAAVPRDHVHVEVHDGLAGGGAGVEADVVAVGVELGVEAGLHLVDEVEDRQPLFVGGGEPISRAPGWPRGRGGVAWGAVAVAGRHGGRWRPPARLAGKCTGSGWPAAGTEAANASQA